MPKDISGKAMATMIRIISNFNVFHFIITSSFFLSINPLITSMSILYKVQYSVLVTKRIGGELLRNKYFMRQFPFQDIFLANIIRHFPEKASGLYEKVIGCIRKAFTFLPFCIAGFHFGDS